MLHKMKLNESPFENLFRIMSKNKWKEKQC